MQARVYPRARLTGVKLKMWEDVLERLKYEYSKVNHRIISFIDLGTYNTVAIFKRVYEKIATASLLLLDILSLLRMIE